MRRQSALVIVVVALAALAGCSALPFGGGGAATVENVEYPNGTSQSGIDSPQQLVNSHHNALDGQDYTITQVQSQQLGNQSQTVQVDLRVDNGDQQFIADIQQSGSNGTTYYEEGTIYSKQIANNSTEYQTQQPQQSWDTFHSQFNGGSAVTQIASNVDFEATEVRESGDHTLIVYNVTGLDEQAQSQQQQQLDTSVSGQLIIDTEGRIHSLSYTQESQIQTMSLSVEINDVGDDVDVERPDWADTAEEQSNTTTTDDSGSQNETDTSTQNETDSGSQNETETETAEN